MGETFTTTAAISAGVTDNLRVWAEFRYKALELALAHLDKLGTSSPDVALKLAKDYETFIVKGVVPINEKKKCTCSTCQCSDA